MIASAKPKLPRCRVPGCTHDADSCRGICRFCYSQSKRLIDKGETTWEELESTGIVGTRRYARLDSAPVVVALQSARAVAKVKRIATAKPKAKR